MTVDFEAGTSRIEAEENGGFDPTEIAGAIEDAGFGAGEIRIEARGSLTHNEDLLALKLPTAPHLLVLAGGEKFDALEAAELPVGARLQVKGRLHPSHGDQPPGMTVQDWRELEPARRP